MAEQYIYKIGDKSYVHRPLVLGQWIQLMKLLKETNFPDTMGPIGIIKALGDQLPCGLAIVLTEEGKPVKSKDLAALAEEVSFAIETDQVIRVIEDFFVCNPIASILERLGGVAKNIMEKMAISKKPSSPSAAATLPGEKKLSGDSPRENANPTSATGEGK